MGKEATSNGMRSVAIGSEANSKGENSIAFAVNANANDLRTIAFGAFAKTTGTASTAIGFQSSTNGANALSIGSFAQSVANSVALGADSTADRENTVSIGGSKGFRQLVNLSSGTQDNDAVNVAQFKSVVNTLGGGASFNDGVLTVPNYLINKLLDFTGLFTLFD